MLVKETPRQYSARKLRVEIERAKVAVMDAQEVINSSDFRLKPTAFQQMTDAALARLDAAWIEARKAEKQDA